MDIFESPVDSGLLRMMHIAQIAAEFDHVDPHQAQARLFLFQEKRVPERPS